MLIKPYELHSTVNLTLQIKETGAREGSGPLSRFTQPEGSSVAVGPCRPHTWVFLSGSLNAGRAVVAGAQEPGADSETAYRILDWGWPRPVSRRITTAEPPLIWLPWPATGVPVALKG